MKLAHPFLESPIIFEENKVSVLVVENPKVLTEIVWELLGQINGGEGRFILSSDLNILELKNHVELVIDLFSLDFNQKKIINKIHSQLKTTAVGTDYYVDTMNLISNIMEYLEKVLNAAQFPLEYDREMDIGGIFKFANIKVGATYSTLVEKVMDYMSLIEEFYDISTFIFVNLKCYLSDEEIRQFYEFVAYNKFTILLLENTVRDKRFEEEAIRLIDLDLCEIY